jgi:hypothetical protein
MRRCRSGRIISRDDFRCLRVSFFGPALSRAALAQVAGMRSAGTPPKVARRSFCVDSARSEWSGNGMRDTFTKHAPPLEAGPTHQASRSKSGLGERKALFSNLLDFGAAPKGRFTSMLRPDGLRLEAVIVPPFNRTASRAMASPRPLPSPFLSDRLSRKNGWKMLFRCSPGTPGPRSRTERSTRRSLSPLRTTKLLWSYDAWKT